MPRAIFLRKIKYKSSLNTFTFGFQTLRHEYAIFAFEFIEVCLRSLREISATRNIKSRLPIKFLTPYEWLSNALPPGQEKTSNSRGMPEGDVEASIWLVHNAIKK